MGTFTNSDGCMYRAATGGINLLKESPGDKPAMQNNTRSHELGSSSSPDPMSIVVFSAIGFTGMGNPKAALECKPGAAVVLIRPADGHESPRLPHNSHTQLHGLFPTPDLMPYPCIASSVLGGKCVPEPALRPKAAAQSVSAEPAARSRPAQRTISTPSAPNQAQPLPKRLQARFRAVDWGRAILKSAFEPKAAGAVTLIWPMYLPMVEVGGGIMSDGRDVKVPRPSTVCIAGVVEGGMG